MLYLAPILLPSVWFSAVMFLETNDSRVDAPQARDVAAAIPSAAPSPDWSIALARRDTEWIEA